MKTISVSDGRKQFSSVINWAEQNQDDVIVQSRGQSKVVIIPFVDYALLQEARERTRKREAIEELRAIAQRIRVANPDITANEADRIGKDVTREAIENLVKKGEVIFEE